MSDGVYQIDIVTTAEGVETGVNRAKNALSGVGEAGRKAGQEAGAAISGIGKEAEKSAQQFDRSEKSIIASIQRRTAAMEAAGKGARAYQEALLVNRGMDVSKFEPYLAQLDSVEKKQKAAAVSADTFSTSIAGALSGLAALAGVSAFGNMVRQAIDAADGMNDLSKSTSIAIETLAGLKLASAQSGAELDGTAQAINKLSVNIGGNAKKFAEIGVTAKEPIEAFKQLADVFKSIDDPQKRAAFGAEALGKSWASAAPLLAEGGNRIQEMIDKGAKLSGVTQAVANDADAFNDAMAEMKASVEGVTMRIAGDMLPVLVAMTNDMGVVAGGVSDVDSAFSPLTETLRAVAVLGGNVMFVLKGVGTEIGGIAAQASAVARRDFAGALAIGDAMKADAEKARSAFDVWESGVVNASKSAKAATGDLNALAAASAKAIDSFIGGDKGTKGKSQAVKDAEELAAVLNKITAKDSGVDASYWKDIETLFSAYQKGKINADAYAESVGNLTSQQKFNQDAIKADQKAKDDALKSSQDYMKSIGDETEQLIKKADAAELENAQIGMTSGQIALLTAQRYQERLAILVGNAEAVRGIEGREAEVFLIEQQISALTRLQNAETIRPRLNESAKDWERFTSQIEQSLTDSLYRSFESGKDFGQSFVDSLKTTLKAAALKLVIQYAITGTGQIIGSVGNKVINSVLGTSGAGGGSGVNYLGLASDANSLYGAYGAAAQYFTGASVGASGYSLAYANGVGALGGDSLGALYTANGGWAGVNAGAAGAGAGEGAAASGSSAGAGAGATVAWIAAIVMGMYMSSEAWKKGILWSNYAKDDQVKYWDAEVGIRASKDKPMAAIFGQEFVDSQLYAILSGSSLSAQIHMQIQKALFGATRVTGSSVDGIFSDANGFTGTSSTNYKKSGGLFSGGREYTKTKQLPEEIDALFEQIYKSVKESLVGVGKAFDDSTLAQKLSGFSTTVRASGSLSLLKVAEEFGAQLTESMGKALFPSIDGLKRAASADGKTVAETWAETFTRVLQEGTSVTRVMTLLGKTMSGVFGRNNADRILYMSDNLVSLFGTIEGMNTSFSTYYSTFYSTADQVKQAWKDMSTQFDSMGLVIPDSNKAFKSLVDSLDLSTESGQALFAALVKLSPAFASVIDSADKLAQEAANKLMLAFTANGQLVPAMANISASLDDVVSSAAAATTSAGSISAMFLDASSAILTFGSSVDSSTDSMTGAQTASEALNAQIDDLKISAGDAKINFAGLGEALSNVDTATFVATVTLVFQTLAARIQGVIGSIVTERTAIRDAALNIVNPSVMSKSAINRAINAIQTDLPSMTGLTAANSRLNSADAMVEQRKKAQENALNALNSAKSASDVLTAADQAKVDAKESSLVSMYNTHADIRRLTGGNVSKLLDGSIAPGTEVISKFGAYGGGAAQTEDLAARLTALDAAQDLLAKHTLESARKVAIAQAAYDASVKSAESAQDSAKSAAKQAERAQVDYAAALQEFAIDAGKSVSKLGRLREETVKYYEAQKALADLMGNSASGIRATVSDYRYSQMSGADQYAKLQADFATAYSMGLSTSGETLAGYGDKINSLLPSLLEKASEVLSPAQYSAAVATALARAEAIATRLETTAPTNYAADSLNMLTSIDAALVALDASSKSAEKIISDAVKAGADRTADGLRAVIAAITGTAIPTFATGGDHAGGLRIVGENGPEIEATGPSRIYNAAQTRSMIGGGDAVVSELRALRREVEHLRSEARATATHTSRLARIATRAETDGQLVRTDSDMPLQVEAMV